MWFKLMFALVSMALIAFIPQGPVSMSFFLLVIVVNLLNSFAQ